jgi:hypothetical protein
VLRITEYGHCEVAGGVEEDAFKRKRESGMSNGSPGASMPGGCGETAMLRGMGGKDLHFRSRSKEGSSLPSIDHVTNDEVAAVKGILRGAAPGKEVSRWAK